MQFRGNYLAFLLSMIGGLNACQSVVDFAPSSDTAAIVIPDGAAPYAPGDASFTLSSNASVLVAGNAATITLTSLDSHGLPYSAGVKSILFNMSGGTAMGSIGVIQPKGDGIFETTFTGTVAGSATTIQAVVNGQVVGSSSISVLHGPAKNIVIQAGKNQLIRTNIAATQSPKVKVVDKYGNIIAGAAVQFDITSGPSTVNDGVAITHSAVTDANGLVEAQWFGGAVAGLSTISISTLGGLGLITETITNMVYDPATPILSGYGDSVYPNGGIAVGGTYTFNLADLRSGTPSDLNVVYSCGYDQTINDTVDAVGNCGSLPGVASFSTVTGAFSWNPTSLSMRGLYELKLGVKDNTSGLSDERIVKVLVKPAFSVTNLLAGYSADHSSGNLPSTTQTVWKDITDAFHGVLNNFDFTALSGWVGAGSVADPYRLLFDGTNDYLDLGTAASTSTSLSIEGWVKPSQVSVPSGGVIVSNSDVSGKGLTLREAKGYKNRIEVVKGSKTYADEVIADSPVSYLRLGDLRGEAPYDIGSAGSTWTVANTMTFDSAGVLGGNDKSYTFNGTNSTLISNNNASLNPATWPGISHEVWFNMSTVQNSMLIGQGPENGTNAFFFILYYANSIWFEYTDGVAWRAITFPFTPTANTWYHLATTFDFTTKAYKLYINGVNVQSIIATFAPLIANMTNKALYVGNYGGGASYVPIGRIDEVAMYNYVLPPARAIAHYNARSNNYSCLSERMDDNQWSHVAATYDGTSKDLKLYNNAVQDCSVTTGAAAIDGTTSQMAMGAALPTVGTPTAGTHFKGAVRDLRVYGNAMTPIQLKSNMLSQAPLLPEVPTSVAGMNLWLKADAITGLANGAAVANWNDVSGVGRVASQSTVANRPIYVSNAVNGLPSVRFDGVNDEMMVSGTNASWTAFLVAKQNAIRASTTHFFSGSSNMWNYAATIPGGTSSISWYHLSWASYFVMAAGGTSNYHLQTYRGNANLLQAWVDGVETRNYPGTGFTTGYINKLGNYTAADTRWVNGEIAELIAYSGTLTDGERRRIEAYLKAKYGL